MKRTGLDHVSRRSESQWTNPVFTLSLLLLFFAVAAAFVPLQASAKGNVKPFPDEPWNNYFYVNESGNSFFYLTKDSSGYDSYYLKEYYPGQGVSTVVAKIEGAQSCWFENGNLYYADASNRYGTNGTDGKITVQAISLKTGQSRTVLSIPAQDTGYITLGVDDHARIYLAIGGKLTVYGADGGKIAQTSLSDNTIVFYGFDSSNNNIYCAKGSYYSSGISIGKIIGTTISFSSGGSHYADFDNASSGEGAELIDGRWLVSYSSGTIAVMESSKLSVSDITDITQNTDLSDGSGNGMWSDINPDKFHMLIASACSYDDSVGSRSAYSKAAGLLFTRSDAQTIVAYDLNKKEKYGEIETTHAPYKLMAAGNSLVVIEKKDELYYVETFSARKPTSLTITGPGSVAAGGHAAYTVQFDGDLQPEYTITSSGPSVLAVDEKGNAGAWKAGTVTLTAQDKAGTIKKSMTVSVTGSKKTCNPEILVMDRDVQFDVIDMIRTADGKWMVTGVKDKNFVAQYLDAKGSIASEVNVPLELSFCGGFFEGKNEYYLVFGQANENDSDSVEVVRVVKYSKNWKRLSACQIKGINTSYPFAAGSCRMTENAGRLYIHTCHRMYKSSDGLKHQANMTFVITESDMKLVDEYSDVMNLSYGYVSHSFDQYIRTDGNYIYRVDHGDGYPRGIAWSRVPVGGIIHEPDYWRVLERFEGDTGQNYTGADLGGYEFSVSYHLVAFTQDVKLDSTVRNVRVATLDKDSGQTRTVNITNYKDGGAVTCEDAKLIRLDDWHFVLLWLEKNLKTEETMMKMVQLDPQGRAVSSPVSRKLDQGTFPIVLSDGSIAWYRAWNNYDQCHRLYRIDPYNLGNGPTEPTAVTLPDMTIAVGEKRQVKPTVTPAGSVYIIPGSTYYVAGEYWYSKDPASIDKNGVVEGLMPGKGTISGMLSNGLEFSCKLTVTEKAETGKDPAVQPGEDAAIKPDDAAAAPTVQKKEKEILKRKSDEAPAGSAFGLLQLRATKVTKNSIKVQWTKVKGASGYIIYGSTCGQKYKKLKKITKGSAKSWTQKKLKKGKYYKYCIIATKKYKGQEKVIASSKTIHIATSGGKVGNYKSVKLTNVKKNKISLKAGKKFTIGAKAAPASKKLKVKNHRKLAYESSNPKVAAVNKNGKITAKKAGKCIVYAYAQNGVFAKVTVTVK